MFVNAKRMHAGGRTFGDIAVEIGADRGTIAEWVSLDDLPERQRQNSLRSTFLETAVLGLGGRIAGTMQNSDDHKLMLIMPVVDGVVAGETDAQPLRKVFSRRRCKREVKQAVAIVPDLVDEARRCCL